MSRCGFLKIVRRVFQCLTFPIRTRRNPTFQYPHSLTGRRHFPRRSPTLRKSRICHPRSRPSHLGTMFRRWVSSLVSRGISKPADERTISKALGSWIR